MRAREVLLLALAALTAHGRPALATPPAAAARPYQVLRAPEGLRLATPDGTLLLELVPELWVSAGPPERQPRRRALPLRPVQVPLAAPALRVRADGGWSFSLLGQHAGARYRLVLTQRPGLPRIELALEAEYGEEVAVREERLRLRAGEVSAQAIDRAYRWRRVDAPLFAGPLDPHLVRLERGGHELQLLGGRGVQGLWARPAAGRVLLDLELDHEGNHPFRPHLTCALRKATRVARGDLSATVQPAGSRRALRAALVAGPLPPLLVARYPAGRRAAVVFTDHADQSSAAKLEALAFGATGALARGEVGVRYPGLVNRGLVYTKSIFLSHARGYAHQLEEPRYRALLGALVRAGVEVVPHSVSGWRDPPEAVRAALATFAGTLGGARAWIDHQPVTNCEAVSSRGWDRAGPWYLLPILASAGYRYLWSAEDLDPLLPSLNLLTPERPAWRRPLLYAFAPPGAPAGTPLALFASSRLFLPRGAALQRLSEEALHQLEEERGLYIAHVYLDTYQLRGHFAPRSLLRLGPSAATYRLRPEADRLFQRLAAHQAAGDLWVTSLSALAEHLLGVGAIELAPRADGALLVSSQASRPVRGLTLLLPDGADELLVDGRPPAGQRRSGGRRELWFDLPPGAVRAVTTRGRTHRPLWAPAAALVLRSRPAPASKGE